MKAQLFWRKISTPLMPAQGGFVFDDMESDIISGFIAEVRGEPPDHWALICMFEPTKIDYGPGLEVEKKELTEEEVMDLMRPFLGEDGDLKVRRMWAEAMDNSEED